jgi:hypothetical protein
VPRVPFIKPELLEQRAEAFLQKYHPSLEIPVPIEQIVEFQLKIDVIPFPNLERDFEHHGFAATGGSIYVDERQMMNQENRYRFTLAHEVGHLLLHRSLYDAAKVEKLESYLRFQESLTVEEIKALEFQARNFGGRILMPHSRVVETATAEYRRVRGLVAGMSHKNLCNGVARRICRSFNVHQDVAETRLHGDKIMEEVVAAESRRAG